MKKAAGVAAALMAPALLLAEPKPLHVACTTIRLDNGLTVIFHEDHTVPIVAVNIWYRVGSANERSGRTGFAHLFEHLMFMGSEHAPYGQFDKLLEAAGGQNNASTANDRTNYYEIVPANAIELPLYLDADRMATLGKAMTQEKLDAQRAVVENEKRQSYDNQPYGRTDEYLLENLFPEGHPYHHMVIGSMKDLDAASLADVKDFFAHYYTPNNAILVLAGDFQIAQAEALVRKYFAWIPTGPPVLPPAAPPVTVPRDIRVMFEDRVDLPRLTMAWVTPAEFQPGDAALDALAYILTGDRTSRLYRSLIHDSQIAEDVGSSQNSMRLASFFTISITAQPGHTLSEVEAAAQKEIDRIKETGPTPEELQRARNVIEAGFLRRLERLGGFGGVADQLAAYDYSTGNPDGFAGDLDRYLKLTAADLREAARQYLPDDHRVVLSVVPNGEKTLAAMTPPAREMAPSVQDQDTVNWGTPPVPGPAPRVRLPKVVRTTLPDGLQVWVMEHRQVPIIRAELVVGSGSADDPQNLPGLASMAADMLTRGTAKYDALEIASRASSLGARLDAEADWDSSVISLDVPVSHWNEALDLLTEVSFHPTFPQAEIGRLKKGRTSALAQMMTDPGAVASLAFDAALYGEKSPYGHSAYGTLNAVKAVSSKDLENFYRRHFTPKNAVLILVGDVDPDAITDQIRTAWGGWSASPAPAEQVPDFRPAAGPRVILIDKPGAAQSAIRVGEIGVARRTKDFFPIEVMNTLLGGSFTSRLNQNLREDHGYTYGAFSRFAMRREPGPFVAAAAVHTEVTAPALAQFFHELRRIAGETPPATDVARAKNFVALGLPNSLQTPGELAARLAGLYLYGLPEDYFDNFVSNVEAVTPAEVESAARKTIHPDRLTVVVVGDLAKIRGPIEKLNIGPVEVAGYDIGAGKFEPPVQY